jgi:hypothetical protein
MRILILPGYGGSGPNHWQSRWQGQNPEWQRFSPRDWDAPALAEWLTALDLAVDAEPEPPLLVAHSLSCLLVGHWGATRRQAVRGAFLVAPPDPDAPIFPAEAASFTPAPQEKLPFPALLVASTNDSYGSAEFAQSLAEAYGAWFLSLGPLGHINTESGHGDWPEGLGLLTTFAENLNAYSSPSQ